MAQVERYSAEGRLPPVARLPNSTALTPGATPTGAWLLPLKYEYRFDEPLAKQLVSALLVFALLHSVGRLMGLST